jgi:hypothetical protein
MSKVCTSCNTEYPVQDFIWDRRNVRGDVYAVVECKRCRFCRSDAWRMQKEWKRRNPGKDYATYKRWMAKNRPRVLAASRAGKYRNKYGLTVGEYELMFAEQGGTCKICHGTGLKNKRLSIDHDHKTGKVRGLLCHGCNVMIGLAKENPAHLHAAVDYLEGLHTSGRVVSIR